MALTFVLVGEPSIPLCEGGADRAVTSENAIEFVSRTVEMLLHTTVHDQVDAFRRGFAAIVPLNILTMLSAADWSLLLADSTRHLWPGGAVEIKTYMVCDHGYTQDSQAISWLVDILVELTPEEQRLFVQFVTGSHRLPLGGLAKLDPPLTVVRKLTTQDESQTNDAVLPSASTCTNYLKLPDYSSKDVMRARLLYVIHEGQLSFHLS
ncbi:Ubiquitin-protein ligase [Aphanomyces cochlioides]|nr:Ubiquitin-protein ligase [Aphanomyces cochlioides]